MSKIFFLTLIKMVWKLPDVMAFPAPAHPLPQWSPVLCLWWGSSTSDPTLHLFCLFFWECGSCWLLCSSGPHVILSLISHIFAHLVQTAQKPSFSLWTYQYYRLPSLGQSRLPREVFLDCISQWWFFSFFWIPMALGVWPTFPTPLLLSLFFPPFVWVLSFWLDYQFLKNHSVFFCFCLKLDTQTTT